MPCAQKEGDMLEVPGKMPIMHRTCGGRRSVGGCLSWTRQSGVKAKKVRRRLCGHPVILHEVMCAWRGGARGAE